MKRIQQAGAYRIYQKRSGRYAVQDKAKKWVNGEEKAKILREAGLAKVAPARPAQVEEPDEATSGEAASGAEPTS